MARKKGVDKAAAKAAKQKKIAIVGFVLFLGVMAFSVPKTLKMLKGPQPVSPPPAQAAPATPPPATPTPATGSPATPTPDTGAPGGAVAGSSAEIVDPGGAPEASEGQLISFERFASKDPFSQQAAVAAPTGATPAAQTPSATRVQPDQPGPNPDGTTTPGSTTQSPSTPTTPAKPSPPTTPTTPAAQPTSAVISVNGVEGTVEAGANFPKDEEMFVLVSLSPTSIKIGIAGGTLTGSSQTVTIEKGKKVTLQNTADGTEYEIVLVSLS
jgi:hypothetical protein